MADQVHRIIYLYKKFLTGRKYTSSEILAEIPSDFAGVSLRTIQRDLVLLQECEPTLTYTKIGKELTWEIPRTFRKPTNLVKLSANELLSFHVLKAHLKTFQGTMIEEEVNHLTDKLEEIAPQEVFSDESLYWDQNIGQFNYSNYDPIIRRVINFTAKKSWIDLNYNASLQGDIHSFTVLFQKLFTYAGYLYVAAYIPKHDTHVALTIQNIESAEENPEFRHIKPEFDFLEWTKNRFGVFYGEIRQVELLIKKKYSRYFQNRRWHQSQSENIDEKGNLILKMRVPICPDFIAWVISWGDAITVQKPDILIKEIKQKLKEALENY